MEDCVKEKINERILMIVESPNKIATLKSFLPKNYIVKASVGHIADIDFKGKYCNTGIDVNNNFKVNYVIDKSKTDIVKELKEQVKLADRVYLCSDPDREGEAIAWSLKEFLKIPDNKYYRVTFHEITKSAVLEALNHPRKIDEALVQASHARRKLDALLGFRMSAIARKNIGAKSVGRCQSAGLELVVEKEKEIQAFIPEKYGELVAHLTKQGVDFKVKYFEPSSKDKKLSYQQCLDAFNVVDESIKNGGYFKVTSIETKTTKSNPKTPFITSTFQQEVSSKLGIGVEKAMSYAQKLFEGINIDGQHIALITYIRTDDANFSPEFLVALEQHVKSTYGDEYYESVREIKNDENSQAGHEAIRPVDLAMTPSKLKNYITDDKLLKVYDIIYRRTVACAMASSITSETTYIFNQSNYLFSMTCKELLFEGYQKVYNYKEKEDESINKITFVENESVSCNKLDLKEKETTPPSRYKEATLIKELEKTGVGRPSTYATIIKILKDDIRGYCTIKDSYLVPTEKGIKLVDFLNKYFSDLINIEYTSNMESDLDKIASGKLDEISFLKSFYNSMENTISNANLPDKLICPNCGRPMKLRKGPYGEFWGCTGYPECKTIVKK